MSEPIVNLEETIGKVVGNRKRKPEDYDRLVDNAMAIMPRLPYPKGVYRFKSHEEANEWQERHILAAALRKHQNDAAAARPEKNRE